MTSFFSCGLLHLTKPSQTLIVERCLVRSDYDAIVLGQRRTISLFIYKEALRLRSLSVRVALNMDDVMVIRGL